SRSAASIVSAHQLSRGTDRLSCEVVSRKRVELSEHSARGIRGIQQESDAGKAAQLRAAFHHKDTKTQKHKSGFQGAIENNLNRCAWFENKVFAAGEKHGGSACSSASGATNHRAFAAVGNDADQCSLRGGGADGLRIVTLAGVALHGRFSLFFTGAADA